MRRVNHLFPQLTAFSNLYQAWLKARKGTGWTSETTRFSFNLERELLMIQQQLRDFSYQPGKFRYFSIRDPKPRRIAVAPFNDRVVHHALVQILMPVFEPTFIYHSYATRTGKGTHKSIIQAQQFIRQYSWYYKFDIKHFFETVNHDVMLALIARKVKDKAVLQLCEKIIRNAPDDSGLPIGNLTSQFFANVYLNPLDHFIKEQLGVKGYLRYMDDFVLFSNSKEELKHWQQALEVFVTLQLKLKLKNKACWLNSSQAGLSFLGMRIFPGLLRHCPANRKRSLKKLNNRIKAFEKGDIAEQQMTDSIQCICAHLDYF